MNFRKRENRDYGVIQAAEQVLAEAVDLDGTLRWVHLENGITNAIREVNHLADEAPKGSETSARLHVAWLALSDALDAFDAEHDGKEDE